MDGVNWPLGNKIKYLSTNNWDGIQWEDFQFINSRFSEWEKYEPFWFYSDLQPRIKVREIFEGHWAWCNDMQQKSIKDNHKKRFSKQFEAVALKDINEEEMICEYVGRVKYYNQVLESTYVAEFRMPDSFPNNFKEKQLCIDALEEGNEARFINSITALTAPHIKQNASMHSVWCREQLRVIIFATQKIKTGEPIILDYNEWAATYFEEQQTKDDFQIQTSYIHIGIKDQAMDITDEEIINQLKSNIKPNKKRTLSSTNNYNSSKKQRVNCLYTWTEPNSEQSSEITHEDQNQNEKHKEEVSSEELECFVLLDEINSD